MRGCEQHPHRVFISHKGGDTSVFPHFERTQAKTRARVALPYRPKLLAPAPPPGLWTPYQWKRAHGLAALQRPDTQSEVLDSRRPLCAFGPSCEAFPCIAAALVVAGRGPADRGCRLGGRGATFCYS